MAELNMHELCMPKGGVSAIVHLRKDGRVKQKISLSNSLVNNLVISIVTNARKVTKSWTDQFKYRFYCRET